MRTVEASTRQDLAREIVPLVSETLVLTAEGLGLPTALRLRGEARALTSAGAGRLVVAGASWRVTTHGIALLVGRPGLTSTLGGLRPVHTTYRFDRTARVTFSTLEADIDVPLSADGALADPAGLTALSSPVVQVDVALPEPLLAWMSVVHLPTLEEPSPGGADAAPALTGSTIAYVTSAATPLSEAEVQVLHRLRRSAHRLVLLVTDAQRITYSAEVVDVNRALTGATEDGPVSVVLLGEDDVAWTRDQLVGRSGPSERRVASLRQVLGLVRTATDAVSAESASPAGPAKASAAAAATASVRDAEAELLRASQSTMTWLPRLGYELTRLRADLAERTARSLAQLEQGHDHWIQRDIAAVSETMPSQLLADLRQAQAALDDETAARLDAVARQLLGARADLLLPGGLQRCIPPTGQGVRLVEVSQLHLDGRTELFASIGNFGSGRQSISMLSSVASVLAAPVALIGGVIGLGFWRVGKRSRQDNQARVQASRWLKVQVAEAGRVLRYRVDQTLNEAQLVLNLAVREHHDQLATSGRSSLEAARRRLAEVEAAHAEAAEGLVARATRASLLAERCSRLEERFLAVPWTTQTSGGATT